MHIPKDHPRAEFKRQLILIEYRESVATFFKGIDIGMAYGRTFMFLNGVLLAVFGINERMAGLLGIDPRFSMIIVPLVSIVGMTVATMMWLILPFYWRQMDVCAGRATEIEKSFGGKLLTRIDETNRERKLITTSTALRFIALTFFIFWLAALCFYISGLQLKFRMPS